MSDVAERRPNPIAEIRTSIDKMEEQFKAALPPHIPVARFKRVLMTAIQQNPSLVHADRTSLWNSAMKSAQDGLLPDGREGAIVVYRTKEKSGGWIDKAQWMPMVFGILKKVRNSGEVASITARVVYEGDRFRYWIDDDGEHVEYEPSDTPNTDVIRRVFAMAKTKDGELYVEPLTADDVEKIRKVSRAKDNGPWVDWWEEMAKKTAIRRLAKRLPMSTDLDDLVRRDDDLYDFSGASDAQVKPSKASLSQTLDRLAARPTTAAIADQTGMEMETIDAETGEVTEKLPPADDTPKDAPATGKPREGQTIPADGQERTIELKGDANGATTVAADFAREVAAEAGEDDFPGDKPLESEAITEARKRGYEGRRKGVARKAVPGEYRGNPDLANAWIDGWLKADDEVKAGGAK